MSFFRYIFRFLYVRNWYTGEKELSYQRLFWVVFSVSLLIIVLLLAWWLQSPATYGVR